MKRAILVGTGTVAGLAAVLALNPSGESTTSASTAVVAPAPGGAAGDGPSGTDSGSGPGSDSGSGSGTSSGSGTAAGSVDGDVISTRWGPVQVRAIVTDGTLSDVVALQLPDGDRRSYEISSSVEPLLREQALAAQSAAIDGVSGATYTSDGYARSLASALARAGL